MRHDRKTHALLLLAFALRASVSEACPDCVTARAARARVFDDGFAFNLFVAVVPFVLIGLFAASMHRIGRPPRVDRVSPHGSEP